MIKNRLIGLFAILLLTEGCVSTDRSLSKEAELAYAQSITLLSDGCQGDAEDLIEQALETYPDNKNLLFARGVLERSRWGKREAMYFFSQVMHQFSGTAVAKAASLSLVLDQKVDAKKNLNALTQLSDANPDNVYLLWLSAIQCREQENGPLGKARYEKLLAKFRVGPVLLHQTYANILEDYLKDYETALKHRRIAVSQEAKGWSLEGLGSTLTKMEQYDEACGVWARAVQVAPDDSSVWGNWGWTLRKMGRYEDALEKHQEACRLNSFSAYNQYYAGKCLEKLGRTEEMVSYYNRSAEMGYKYGQFKMGYLFHQGIGVAQDFEKAAKWYRLAADQGHPMAWSNLGLLYGAGKGVPLDYNEQLSCYKKALKIDSNHANALNNYACLLVDCKDKTFRDYPQAVELAERSVELDEQGYSLDTLADAYDRNGQYDKAVKAQKRLIAFRQKKNPGKLIPQRMAERLKQYENKLTNQN